MVASGAATGAMSGRCAEPAVNLTGWPCPCRGLTDHLARHLARHHRREEVLDRRREVTLDLIGRHRDHRSGDLAEEW